MVKNTKFEKCPYCGAWKLVNELTNHIGACLMFKKAEGGRKNG